MRSAGNFSPEWGYLAPAPSFARTARVVLVATAIGATAGAGVVLSLIDRPNEPEKMPVAARAIVTSVRATAVTSVSPAAPVAVAPTAAAVPAKPPSQPASVAAAPIAPANAATNAVATTGAPAARPSASQPSSPAPAAAQAASARSAAAGDFTAATPVTTSESVALPSEQPKFGEAAPADGSESIVAPEQATPAKKTKHHAAAAKPTPFAGIGSALRRMFAAHGSRSYYPH